MPLTFKDLKNVRITQQNAELTFAQLKELYDLAVKFGFTKKNTAEQSIKETQETLSNGALIAADTRIKLESSEVYLCANIEAEMQKISKLLNGCAPAETDCLEHVKVITFDDMSAIYQHLYNKGSITGQHSTQQHQKFLNHAKEHDYRNGIIPAADLGKIIEQDGVYIRGLSEILANPESTEKDDFPAFGEDDLFLDPEDKQVPEKKETKPMGIVIDEILKKIESTRGQILPTSEAVEPEFKFHVTQQNTQHQIPETNGFTLECVGVEITTFHSNKFSSSENKSPLQNRLNQMPGYGRSYQAQVEERRSCCTRATKCVML